MTFTRRFPAAARLVVEAAIDAALLRLREGKVPAFALDEQEPGELEVIVLAVDYPAKVAEGRKLWQGATAEGFVVDEISPKPECVVDFDALTSRTEKARAILGIPILTDPEMAVGRFSLRSTVDRLDGSWCDEQPIAAHGVAEEDGA